MSAAAVARRAALRAARRPSTWGLAALALVPAIIAAIAGAAGGVASSAGGPLAIMVIAPLFVVALVAATAGDGYAQRTVVYWFVRPMARTSVVLGDFAGHAAISAAVMLASGVLLAVATLVASGGGEVATLARVPLGLALEAVVLAAVAEGVGTLVPKHPVGAALALLAVTEVALPGLWGPLAWVSMTRHIGSITGLPPTSLPGALTGEVPQLSMGVGALVLLVYAAVPLLAAMRAATERDLA